MTDTDARPVLYFVRHGETEWSLSGRHTGRTDIPLTTRGVEAARALAPRLQHTQFGHVLTSPRLRARQTCGLVGLLSRAVIDQNLAEWDYGDYEGRRSVDVLKERPDWNLFRDGCPHGETATQVCDRADRLLARLRVHVGNVALFSHGQFGSVLAVRWIGLPLLAAQHFPLGPASLSLLGYDPHHRGVAVMALWNELPGERVTGEMPPAVDTPPENVWP